MAWDTARVVFLCNRKYVLSTSWFWKQLFECQGQPRDLRNLIDVVAGFMGSTQTELVNATEELWLETMKMVRAHAVSIESMDIVRLALRNCSTEPADSTSVMIEKNTAG
ncbi:hypothetical protein E6H32_06995 [Candidatus Bathyarchaeota archaeon]|nr:MAG: hypothetical protein E6H32_06995 [Candidatus Bathyarchaeota archaeon]